MSERPLKSFEEFWPYYVSEHSKQGTRALHLIGTLVGLAFLLVVVALGRWWLFPIAFVPGYGCAWLGHFLIEHNRPATFQYPLWSFMGDYRMVALMVSGKMGREVRKVENHQRVTAP
jgi:hypothetical protein